MIIKRLGRGILPRRVKKVCGRHGIPINGTKNEDKNRKKEGEIQRGGKSYTTWRVGLLYVERWETSLAASSFSSCSSAKSCQGFSGISPTPSLRLDIGGKAPGSVGLAVRPQEACGKASPKCPRYWHSNCQHPHPANYNLWHKRSPAIHFWI